MAKASNVSDRNSRENSLLIQQRPCLKGCGGMMTLAVLATGWRSIWSCEKCGHQTDKKKGDYTMEQALQLKAAKDKEVEVKKARAEAKKVFDEKASTWNEIWDGALIPLKEMMTSIQETAIWPFRDKSKELDEVCEVMDAKKAELLQLPEFAAREKAYSIMMATEAEFEESQREVAILEHRA